MKKTHAHLQSCINTCVKFQKDQPETVKGVALTRHLLHMHFNNIKGKKVKVKNPKLSEKNNFRIMKNTACTSSDRY